MAVALLALFVALTGTAIAGSGLITGAQIKDRSVGYVDLSGSAVAKLRGNQGRTGPAGPAGVAGGFDPAKVSYIAGTKTDLPPNAPGVTNLQATCPAGSKAIGGGAFIGVAFAGFSGPTVDGTSWAVVANNATSVDVPAAYAVAVCAAP
jgi:hypothetical protein